MVRVLRKRMEERRGWIGERMKRLSRGRRGDKRGNVSCPGKRPGKRERNVWGPCAEIRPASLDNERGYGNNMDLRAIRLPACVLVRPPRRPALALTRTDALTALLSTKKKKKKMLMMMMTSKGDRRPGQQDDAPIDLRATKARQRASREEPCAWVLCLVYL